MRDCNRTGHFTDKPLNSLPNPPCRVGTQFYPAGMVKLIECKHQTLDTFGHDIFHVYASLPKLQGDGSDQPNMPLDQFFTGFVRPIMHFSK